MDTLYAKVSHRISEVLPDLQGAIFWGHRLAEEGEWENYIVLETQESGEREVNTGEESVRNINLLVKIYCNCFEDAVEYGKTISIGFWKFESEMDGGYRIIDSRLISETLFKEPDRWHDGTEIWDNVLLFEFLIQETMS
jgi:hypothetical protein